MVFSECSYRKGGEVKPQWILLCVFSRGYCPTEGISGQIGLLPISRPVAFTSFSRLFGLFKGPPKALGFSYQLNSLLRPLQRPTQLKLIKPFTIFIK